MADKTGISWTEATWNPIRGCSKVSEGCRHCYAATVAARFSGPGQPYEGLAFKDATGQAQWTGQVAFVEKHLEDPLRWRRPRRVFVNSMSDLFHPSLPEHQIIEIFAVMVAAHWHSYQVLTKRPKRMARFMRAHGDEVRGLAERAYGYKMALSQWPPRNVQLGTSIEDQEAADERGPHLQDTPAALRFFSCEPLLGPLHLDLEGISWVIVGGESGPKYRPMDLDWPRDILHQCRMNGVPFFFKQIAHRRPGQMPWALGEEIQEYPEAFA